MPLRKFRQTFVACAAGMLVLLTVAAAAAEESTDPEQPEDESFIQSDLVQKQLQQIETDQIEQYWRDLHENYRGFLPTSERDSMFDTVLPSREKFDLKETVFGFFNYFMFEIVQNLKLLGTIAVLALFCMILQYMQTAFEQNAVSKVAYAVAYLVLIILAVNSLAIAVSTAKETIGRMVDFMMALIPLILTLLGSMGNFTSVALFHPLIIFLVHFIGSAVYTVIFPLLFFSVVLGIVSAFAEKYPLTNLAKLMRNISIGLLGIFLTVFLGVVSVQGAGTAVMDGVTIRTAKYVTDTFVPVVGGMFAEAADTVVGASLLVKNAIGMSGVVILLFICIFPALKILALALIYNFTGAVMQPLGDSPIIRCLGEISKGLITIFAAMATVGLMFFIALTVIITAGNISVMMR